MAVVPLILISFAYKWFCGAIPVYCDVTMYTKKVTLYTGLSFFYQNSAFSPLMTFLVRVLGALVDGVSVALLLCGCLYFVKALRYYQQGELFSANTIALFHKMVRIAFVWTVYEPIKFTLLSFVTTCASPAGQRVITIGITSQDVIHIFIVGFALIITSLMQEAYALKNEHDLTV